MWCFARFGTICATHPIYSNQAIYTTNLDFIIHISSVIRQKGEFQNECFKKTKYAKHFLQPPPPFDACVCVSGGKKCSFFGKFGVLCFLETPTLRFVLLPYCLRFQCFRQSSSHLKCLMLLVNWKVLASCNHFHNFSFYHIEVVW